MTDQPKIDDGGPAFPKPCDECSHCTPSSPNCNAAQTGMTLLDYFAAAALTGLVSSKDPGSIYEITECAYDYADAMVAERRLRMGGGE